MGNNGTALAVGSSKYGMGEGLRVQRTVFARNTGPIVAGGGGGAVTLAGQGTAAVFESVRFLDNSAGKHLPDVQHEQYCIMLYCNTH